MDEQIKHYTLTRADTSMPWDTLTGFLRAAGFGVVTNSGDKTEVVFKRSAGSFEQQAGRLERDEEQRDTHQSKPVTMEAALANLEAVNRARRLPRPVDFPNYSAYMAAAAEFAGKHFQDVNEKRRLGELDHAREVCAALVPPNGFATTFSVDRGKLEKALQTAGSSERGAHPESEAGQQIRRRLAMDVARPAMQEVGSALMSATGERGPLAGLASLLAFMVDEDLIRS